MLRALRRVIAMWSRTILLSLATVGLVSFLPASPAIVLGCVDDVCPGVPSNVCAASEFVVEDCDSDCNWALRWHVHFSFTSAIGDNVIHAYASCGGEEVASCDAPEAPHVGSCDSTNDDRGEGYFVCGAYRASGSMAYSGTVTCQDPGTPCDVWTRILTEEGQGPLESKLIYDQLCVPQSD